jgi:hypothetical protein
VTSDSSGRLKLGAATLAVAVVLFFAGLTHPDAVPPGVAQTISSAHWFWGHLGLIISHVLLIFGLLALYGALAGGRTERGAFIGLILSLVGIGLSLPLFGVLAFAFPSIGQKGDVDLAGALLNSPAMAIFLGSGSLLLAIGAVLFAVAVARSGRLSSVAAIVYAVGSVALVPEPVLGQVGRSLVGLILLVGGVALAASIWSRAAAPATISPARDRSEPGGAARSPAG